MIQYRKSASLIARAARPAVELLETRQLLSATLGVSSSLMVFNAVENSSASQVETLTLTDTGDANLTLGSSGISIVNDPNNGTQDAARFTLVNAGSAPATLTPGQSFGLQLKYSANAVVTNSALLNLVTNDPASPTTVKLHGIGTRGLGGTNQPSLATILRAYDIPTIVGEGVDDANAATDLTYPEPPDASSQEVDLQRLTKAGTGPVTITTLASFTASGTKPYTLGTYTPGNPNSLSELFFTPTAEYQSTYVQPEGTTTFDPGLSQFGFYFVSNVQVTGRHGYTEDALNTWDTTDPRKFRFFPMENPDGSVVANSYIMTTTEWNAPIGYDFTNIVAIVSNVKAATGAPSGPVLGLTNQNAEPGSSNIIFNRISSPNATLGDVVHDTSILTVNNTGNQPLIVSSYTLSSAWTLVSPPTFPLTVAAGASYNLTIKFIGDLEPSVPYNETNSASYPSGGGVYNGTLTLNSNDPNTPTATENLTGWRQYHSENDNEPSLQTIVNLLEGWGTNINPTPIPTLTETSDTSSASTPTYYGEETVSAYWKEADPSTSVSVQQLAAYHTEGNTTTSDWYLQGSSSASQLFVTATDDGQTLFPYATGTTTPAAAKFTTTGIFGFKIDSEYSDDTKNALHTGGGHHMRFYPVRDSKGNLVPNTYIMTMDYGNTPQNFDFQDNVYVITNIRPAAVPPAPTDFNSSMVSSGNLLQWAPVTYSTLLGYKVYSSSSLTGTYSLLTSTPITATTYTDTTASTTVPTYYKVTAVDSSTSVESLGILSVAALPTTPATTGGGGSGGSGGGGTGGTGGTGGGGTTTPAGSPVAANETASTMANTPVTITEFADASDSSGTLLPATVLVSANPANGSTAVDATSGNITYTPAAGFTGTDSFQYTISDSTGATSSPATITITVSALPIGNPIAANLSVSTGEGVLVTVDVAASATDSGAATITRNSVVITQSPQHGSASVNSVTGVISYMPAAGYSGSDSLTYTIGDTLQAVSADATLSIAVVPTPLVPVAASVTSTTSTNGTAIINVVGSATDASGTINPGSVIVTTDPVHGTATVDTTTGAITYTPATNFVGTDSLQYTVGDSLNSVSAPATVSLSVGVTINATTAKSLSFVDTNGSKVMLALTGGGSAQVFFNGTGTSQTIAGAHGTGTVVVTGMGTGVSISSINATGTGVASSLVISRKGVAAATVGAITVAGPLAKISAATTSLTGDLSVTGGLGSVQFSSIANSNMSIGSAPAIPSGFSLSAGHVSDSTLTSAVAIRSIKVLDWTESTIASTITAPSINSLVTTGNFQAGLTLTGGSPFTLNTARIGGQISDDAWSVAGNTNSVMVGSVASGWAGTFGQTVNSFTVKTGGLSGSLTAGTLKSARIVGNLSGASITLTNGVVARAQSLGKLSVTGITLNSQIISAGNIGSITSTGISGSSIEAGIASGVLLPVSSGDIDAPASITSISVVGHGSGFTNSDIGASAVGSLNLGIIATGNDGIAFGVGALTINSIIGVLDSGGVLRLNKAALATTSTVDAYFTLHHLDANAFVVRPGV